MIYIPIIGFIYAAARVIHAQNELSARRMSLNEEWAYFTQFNTATIVTLSFIAVMWACARIMALRSGGEDERF